VERLSKALEAAKASEGATLSSKLQLQEALHELQVCSRCWMSLSSLGLCCLKLV
jgi:hypothetical protein